MAPFAWTCMDFPDQHGSFPQHGLDVLSECFGVCQPKNRYACPVCLANGRSGWVKPATEAEGARIVLNSKEN